MSKETVKVAYLVEPNHEKIVTGLIVCADRDIGITIVNADNHNYLACINGPLSPSPSIMPKDEYYALYDFIMRQIESGYIRLPDVYYFAEVLSDFSADTNPSTSKCAFNQ